MHRSIKPLIAIMLAGCAAREPKPEVSAPVAVAAEAGSASEPPRIAPVVSPHTGRVALVATTDRGDAAISLDNQGALRLWTALDGSREPVIVHAAAPRQMVIGRNTEQLVVAIVDEANGVEVLRFDVAGGLLGRVKLPAEPAAEEVAIAGAHVVVRRRDHSIARYDARGTARGRLSAEPKQQLTGLAVRRGAVLVGIAGADDDGRASVVRFLDLGESLAWGKAFTLPAPLAELALAPGLARIAGFDREGRATIVDLWPPEVAGSFEVRVERRATGKSRRRPEPPSRPLLGFTADDQLAVSTPYVRFAKEANEWTAARDGIGDFESFAAIGDVAVFGSGAGLALADGRRTRELGYRKMGRDGSTITDGLRILHGAHETFWLDGNLRVTRTLPDDQLGEHNPDGPNATAQFALDDGRVLVTRSETSKHSGKQFVEIRDLAAKKSTRIGELGRGHSYHAIDRATGVVAFRADPIVARMRLDGTQLRPLAGADDGLLPIQLTDPARAGGVCAIVQTNTVKVFRVPAEGDVPGTPIEAIRVKTPGAVVGFDRAANMYVTLGEDLVVYALAAVKTAGREPVEAPAPTKFAKLDAQLVAVSDDGETLAFLVQGGVAGYDRSGARRWFARVDKPSTLDFRGDTVIAGGESGYVALSARTGERVASACGWAFGLYDRGSIDMAPNVPSTCADGR